MTCGGGTKTRSRRIVEQAEIGSVTCPHLKEDEPCSDFPCKRGGSHDDKKKEGGKFDNLFKIRLDRDLAFVQKIRHHI